jgi:hypothetical protein
VTWTLPNKLYFQSDGVTASVGVMVAVGIQVGMIVGPGVTVTTDTLAGNTSSDGSLARKNTGMKRGMSTLA